MRTPGGNTVRRLADNGKPVAEVVRLRTNASPACGSTLAPRRPKSHDFGRIFGDIPFGDIQQRRGFTLVELMVVIGILLLTTYLTVALVKTTQDGDRLRSSARQMQSAILGARDRAIHAGKADPNSRRGLRFLLNTEDNNTVSSMVFIRSTEDWTAGAVRIGYTDLDQDDNPDDAEGSMSGVPEDITGARAPYASPLKPYNEGEVVAVRSMDASVTQWKRLYDQGLLINGARIKIPDDSTGSWYTVDTTRLKASPSEEILTLTTEYRTSAAISYLTASTAATKTHHAFSSNAPSYRLELAPTVLPSQEPMRLSSGIMIDLNPNIYGTPGILNLPPYTTHIDIMFTPRGTIWGPLSARGLVHFWLAEADDIVNNRPLLDANPQDAMRDKLLVTLFTQTGTIGTFPVDVTDLLNNSTSASGADGYADDPLHYAKVGGVAGK